jgi:hypothetical protein
MISKTQFKEFSRCPRYVALYDASKHGDDAFIDADIETKEMLLNFFDDDDDLELDSLEILLPYYKKTEELAAQIAAKTFNGKVVYGSSTFDQPYFERWGSNYQFSSYADIVIEGETPILIEVKASTTNKLVKHAYSVEKVDYSLFEKEGVIYHLKDKPEDSDHHKGYTNKYNQLFDRYNGLGRYIFDIAIQAWITEEQSFSYYLALLNHEYVFDGSMKQGEPDYQQINGEEIINFLDVTEIVSMYQSRIKKLVDTVEAYVDERSAKAVPLGPYCERNKSTECPFKDFCWGHVPEKNSVLTYSRGQNGWGDPKITPLGYINNGKPHMLAVPYEDLKSEKHLIQYNVVSTKQTFVNPKKMKAMLDTLTFPLYHLDFESFPCPLPRFYGEKPYTQSVFQYSLHIQHAIDDCDFDHDHKGYLATNESDERLALVEQMIHDIGPVGTVIVWNEKFEKGRLKELAVIFPEQAQALMNIHDRVFDLMYVVDNKKELFKELGFSKLEIEQPNFYHEDLQGSYSIKKVLPIFTELSYSDLEISNGSQALVTYAKLPQMDEATKKATLEAMVAYCKQDTWAMVEIHNALHDLANKKPNS